LLESYVPDFINNLKEIFLTPYLWNSRPIKIAFFQNISVHTLLDFTQGSFQSDIIEKLGLEDGKAYLTDIGKVLDYYSNKN
jgi:hypothetical protein